jgi:hypothetical protein
MNIPGRAKLSQLSVGVWQELCAAGYGQNCCILAAGVTLSVVRALGPKVQAWPHSVIAHILNEPATLLMMTGKTRSKHVDEWQAAGAWFVGLGRVKPGHVVTVVDGKWLIDPTIPQVNQPTRGVQLGPLVCRSRIRAF